MSDDSRVYTEDEERHLALNLQLVTAEVHAGTFHARAADTSLLCGLHAAIFEGVRGHAGRHRTDSFGTEYLTFGPNRSAHRSTVGPDLRTILHRLRASLASFRDYPEDPEYEHKALQLAAWTHAELIRVHPFEDGNGRACRLFMNLILIKLGFRPVAFEVPKQEYHACLNHYFAHADIQPLTDLILRAYRLDN